MLNTLNYNNAVYCKVRVYERSIYYVTSYITFYTFHLQ